MKKYIIALAISSMAFIMNAQEQGQRHKPDPRAQTEKMTQELGLSPDQKAKVLAVNTDAAQKMEALQGGESSHEQRKQIQQDKEAKLKTILTEEQFQKYTQLKEEHHHKSEH